MVLSLRSKAQTVFWGATPWIQVEIERSGETWCLCLHGDSVKQESFKLYASLNPLTHSGNYTYQLLYNGGTRWRSWLRHCATSRKVAGAITDCVIGVFHWNNLSGHTMALGVKPTGELRWQPYHFHVPIVLKSGSFNLLQPSGPVQACKGIALPLPLTDVEHTKFYVLPTHCIYVFCVDLRTNSDYFPIQH